jgi:hypothetical protein
VAQLSWSNIMGIFGWSLPPGCGALPGEEEQALDLSDALRKRGIPLSLYWLEDGRIVPGDQVNIPQVDKLVVEWNDDLTDAGNIRAAVREVARRFPKPRQWYFTLRDMLEKRGYETPYQLGRALYKWTDCGPWTVFYVPDDGKNRGRVYYEDEAATRTDWLDACTGIGVGSIVEGSDAEVGPTNLSFPFFGAEFDVAVEDINSEACALWDEANAE